MKHLKIGVLGGIGPEATGIFYLKLIEKLQSEGLIKENGDFPQIFINSIPAPELIFDKIEDTQLEMYQKGLFELDKMQPDFIIMVCNTIHLFHEELQSKIKTEIINLRQVVHDKIKNLKLNNVTVVGTPSTISLGLYYFNDINYFNPNKNEIKELSGAVFNFNKGINKDIQKKKVEKIVRNYLATGSQLILLACTEFAVMLDSLKIPKLNTLDVMVEYVVERCKKLPPKCEV